MMTKSDSLYEREPQHASSEAASTDDPSATRSASDTVPELPSIARSSVATHRNSTGNGVAVNGSAAAPALSKASL